MVSYGPNLNTAAVVLSSYGNVPTEKTALLIDMLLGMPVSAGFVDRAAERLDGRLSAARFDEAMQTALLRWPSWTGLNSCSRLRPSRCWAPMRARPTCYSPTSTPRPASPYPAPPR
jgi:hypothetical protein